MKCFQSFRLDTANQCIWRGQECVPNPPKAYDVLRYLVENPERLVTPDELLEKLWPETYVNPEVLRKYILDIRKILGDRPDRPEFIETVTKRGYRFIAQVGDDSAAEPADLNRSDATAAHAKEQSQEHETVRFEHQRSPLKRSLWKFVFLPLLAAGAAAGVGREFPLRRNGLKLPS